MERKHIIRFLNARKRGAYTWLVEMYSDLFTSMSVTMAMELIKEDLAKETGSNVELHYFSLTRAAARFKKKAAPNLGTGTKKKREFRDSHEIKEKGQLSPGMFKVAEAKVKDGQ